MSVVGIDLGTTFSAIAHLDAHGKPVTIPNSEGELTTPSCVLFEKGGDVVVGREARRIALSEPAHVAEDVKRYMGDADYPKLINGKKLTPPEISALIIKKLRQDAEKRVGKIEGAVITVPAYFDEGRRQATVAAGEIAGMRVLDILNEPTAAALAYAYARLMQRQGGAPAAAALDAEPPRTVVVYDLGGGTFDVTVLRIHGKDLKVLATAGDVRLGGRDWDQRLFDHMADQFLRAHGLDPRDDPVSFQNLMLAAEETKKILSQRQQTKFVVNHAGKTLSGEVTRDELARITEDLLYRTESRLVRVVEQAGLDWTKVDEVLAVGGSTRLPQVMEMLRRVTGKEPNVSLSPDEAIAHGAAIYAAMYAVKAADAPKAKAADTGRSAAFGKLPPLAPPPHEDRDADDADDAGEPSTWVVGMKRAASRIVDLLRSLRTTNVNAHTLGVVAKVPEGGNGVSVLIPSNTQLPVSVTRRYGTVAENQTSVTVRIVEGESKRPEDCIPVGACQIKLLPSGMPKGSPIDVTFHYDGSGRLHVEAVEPETGTWATTTIQRRFGLDHGKIHLNREEVKRVKVS